MNEEIQTLRNRLRQSLFQSRQLRKEIFVDRKRIEFPMDTDVDFTEAEMTNVIRRLKKHGAVESKDLNNLRLFLSKSENIPLFFKQQGSLKGLVGELTGTDTDKQYLAAQCLCHLSLGTKYNCLAIAKQAGIYLITILVGQDQVFGNLSCLILCNLVNSSPKASQTLQQQGLTSNLIYIISNKKCHEMKVSAMIAFATLLRSCPSVLKMAEYSETLEILSDFSDFSVHQARLMFALSANTLYFTPIFTKYKLFTKMTKQLVILVNRSNWDENLLTVIYSLRFMANCIWDTSVIENEQDALLQEDFISVLKKLLVCQRKMITDILLWFFGNIENHSSLSLQWRLDYLGQFSGLIAMCIP